jgi:hypothetical protein
MMCPHCRANLRQKERPNLTCSKCHKGFAFDPKDNPLMLHDLLVGKVVDRLSDQGRLRYTAAQLWYASARKTVRLDSRVVRPSPGILFALLALGFCGFGVARGFTDRNAAAVVGYSIPLLLLVAGGIVWVRRRRQRAIEVRLPWPKFDADVVRRWQRTYGEPPRGMVSDGSFTEPVVLSAREAEPALAVLSPDRGVLACLQANLVPERLSVALVRTVEQVPPGVPVLLVHDASPAGCLLASEVRAALPGRTVVDAGLRPQQVMSAKGAIRLRTARPPEAELQRLRALATLTEKELEWLAKGWWSPVAALRPTVLITKVQTTVGRALTRDPAHRAAAAVGYLTWPAA